jgi:hypothetical protein
MMDSDQLLDELIFRKVKGEPSPFPIDEAFPAHGSFESRYEKSKGDKQILLWAILDCAKNSQLIPPWAVEALKHIMLRGVARGQFASWEEAFGPIRVLQQRTIRGFQHMVAVWIRIRELHDQEGRPIDDLLFEDVSKEFDAIGIGKVKDYHGRMQRFMDAHPDIWIRVSNASVTQKTLQGERHQAARGQQDELSGHGVFGRL